ncbi:MAG: GAF domain-containing sensor histidine kinase [Coleofasciculus sp. B1-GNL1-01]|uniref:GAF domain-containing sensor histidine kinase n=1 Tax=Coleofasciculus sp. B1-GNL1-01 TaxID=3068484 RepID=UPI0032F21CBA
MHYPPSSSPLGQQIISRIIASPNPQTLLASIAQVLGEAFQVDCCLIAAPSPETAIPQLGLWYAEGGSKLQPQPQNLGQYLWLTGVEKPLAIRDIQESDLELADQRCWDWLPVRAVLRLYTWCQSRINGMIVLGRSQPYDWTIQDKQRLSEVAESVAVAIAHVQLTQQVDQSKRYQTLLSPFSQFIQSDRNLDETMAKVVASTTQALQADRGWLLLFNDNHALDQPHHDGKHQPPIEVKVVAEWCTPTLDQSVQLNSQRLLNQSFRLSESYLCQTAWKQTPEPIAIADWANTPIRTQEISLFEEAISHGVLMVSLCHTFSNGSQHLKRLGFLVVQQDQPRLWQGDDIEWIRWVATQLSELIHEHQNQQPEPSRLNHHSVQPSPCLTVPAQLHQSIRQQVDQLQELNQLKEEFISTMNHELRTPLTAMSLAIRMLRQPKLPAKRRQKYLDILEQQCNQEIDLINDLLSLQQLESNPAYIQKRSIDVILLIQTLAQDFEQKWASKSLTLNLDCSLNSLMIHTDPESLNRILLELLTNAGKYSHPDTTVSLKVEYHIHAAVNQLVLTLTNIGDGILPTDINYIFEKFRRGQGITKQAVPGTGLGLALVKCLVNHLNGAIEVASQPLDNSHQAMVSFTLTLPD